MVKGVSPPFYKHVQHDAQQLTGNQSLPQVMNIILGFDDSVIDKKL